MTFFPEEFVLSNFQKAIVIPKGILSQLFTLNVSLCGQDDIYCRGTVIGALLYVQSCIKYDFVLLPCKLCLEFCLCAINFQERFVYAKPGEHIVPQS